MQTDTQTIFFHMILFTVEGIFLLFFYYYNRFTKHAQNVGKNIQFGIGSLKKRKKSGK